MIPKVKYLSRCKRPYTAKTRGTAERQSARSRVSLRGLQHLAQMCGLPFNLSVPSSVPSSSVPSSGPSSGPSSVPLRFCGLSVGEAPRDYDAVTRAVIAWACLLVDQQDTLGAVAGEQAQQFVGLLCIDERPQAIVHPV